MMLFADGLLRQGQGSLHPGAYLESPATLLFKSGNCLPVCAPEHSPNYGYYQTQWRPWSGMYEAVQPGMMPE